MQAVTPTQNTAAGPNMDKTIENTLPAKFVQTAACNKNNRADIDNRWILLVNKHGIHILFTIPEKLIKQIHKNSDPHPQAGTS